MSFITKAIRHAGPNACTIKVGNNTAAPIQGFGDQSTVHVMDEDGNYLTGKKFDALGNGPAAHTRYEYLIFSTGPKQQREARHRSRCFASAASSTFSSHTPSPKHHVTRAFHISRCFQTQPRNFLTTTAITLMSPTATATSTATAGVHWLCVALQVPVQVLFHASVVVRLSVRLLTHLVHGSGRWITMAARLLAYVLLLLPAFCSMLRFWLLDPRVVRHVAYGRGETQRNLLDIYLPSRSSSSSSKKGGEQAHAEKLPVIVFFTGGAWIIGYKAWGALMAQSLAESGFVVVIPDYRNFPQATIGDMIEDARNALAWVFENVSKYGGDPEKVAVAGQSAGAHISACLLVDQMERELKAAKHAPETTFSWKLSQISMYFGISGPYNLCTMEKYFHERGLDSRILKWIMQSDLARFSPSTLPFRDDLRYLAREQGELLPAHPAFMAYQKASAAAAGDLACPRDEAFDENIGKLLPPIALFHGEVDKSVPYTVAVEFAENLKLAGAIVHLRIYEHWSHTDPILEGPMGGDDSLCYDMMVAYSKVLNAKAAFEKAPVEMTTNESTGKTKLDVLQCDTPLQSEESKIPETHAADKPEAKGGDGEPEAHIAVPPSSKSAKRRAKKKQKQRGIVEDSEHAEQSTASILSEPETSVPLVPTETEVPIVEAALVESPVMYPRSEDDLFSMSNITSKRAPMASAFFIQAARYINPF